MEICRKLPVSACGPDEWVVGIDGNNNQEFDTGEAQRASEGAVSGAAANQLLSGTTAKPAIDPADRRYPRRLAFVRHISGPNQHKLVPDGGIPVALGINTSDVVAFYAAGGPVSADGGISIPNTQSGTPKPLPNSLWYATTTTPANPTTNIDYGSANPLFYAKLPTFSGGVAPTFEQPRLRPTLQIYLATNTTPTGGNTPPEGVLANAGTRWIQKARDTEFNLIVASNDVPSRALPNLVTPPTIGETNGGLQNLPRFMENWQGLTTSIAGSFIQFKRSAYATAPYQSVINDTAAGSVLNAKVFDDVPTPATYKIENFGGKVGYFVPPNRNWGFDVGLLSQPADLFAQKFTLPPSKKTPDEYFREISRDDEWVKSLVFAEKLNPDRTPSGTYAVNDSATKPTDCPI